MQSLRFTTIAALVLVGLGVYNAITGDLLDGAVWALLGIAVGLFQPVTDEKGRPLRYERNARTIAGAAAAVIATILLVYQIVTRLGR